MLSFEIKFTINSTIVAYAIPSALNQINKFILISWIEKINFIIIDNGLGFEILADNIKNILNPYFTTKKKGTGLGLSIVNKIINDHNGKINFISLENGAKIEIIFTR